MTAWTFTDADREFVARHVEPYLPDRIFDAHAHLFCHAHYPPGKLPAHLSDTPGEIGLQVYREHIDWLHPGGRTVGGLFFGLAFQGDRTANDEYVAAEVKAGQAAGFKSLGQMLIAPEMDPELVRETALQQASDATTEAARLLALHKVRRDYVQAEIWLTQANAAIDLGSVVQLTTTRLGYGAGRKFIVVGLTVDGRRTRMTLDLWG